jgi:SAM-dependent methyltransferase
MNSGATSGESLAQGAEPSCRHVDPVNETAASGPLIEGMVQRKRDERLRYDRQSEEQAIRPYDNRTGSASMRPALRAPYEYVEEWLRVHAPGKRILDYGSGLGAYSIASARFGAEVIGVDISSRSVEYSTLGAQREHVSGRCRFLVGDCERLPFQDGVFDIVLSMGAFSSLDSRLAFMELARVVRPSGTVVIVDTLGHNPFLNLNRLLLKRRGKRTQWEVDHILRLSDVRHARTHFRRQQLTYFDLCTLPLAPFYPSERGRRRLLSLAQNVDRLVLKIPLIRPFAFKIVCIFTR